MPDLQPDIARFFSLLNPALNHEIKYFMYKQTIQSIKLLSSFSKAEKIFFVQNIQSVVFLPGDQIIRQGDDGDKLYFITHGIVEIFIGPEGIEDNELSSAEKVLNKFNPQSGGKFF